MIGSTSRWLAFLMFMLALLVGRPAQGCSCVSDAFDLNHLYETSDVVFLGKVTSLRNRGFLPARRSGHRMRFDLIETFKGELQKEVSISSSSGTCGVALKAGQTYLIHANRVPKKGLFTGHCSQPKSLQRAESNLRYLRRLLSGEPPFQCPEGAVLTSVVPSRDDLLPGVGCIDPTQEKVGEWTILDESGAILDRVRFSPFEP